MKQMQQMEKMWIVSLLSLVCLMSSIMIILPVSSQAAFSGSDFAGSIILGRATNSSITASITNDQPVEVYLEWGEQSNAYTSKSSVNQASSTEPAVIVMDNLDPSGHYYYRLLYKESGAAEFSSTPEYSFHTPRAEGETYHFVIQSDSHLLNKADKDLYLQSMKNMAALKPDFMFDLGDTFLNDQGKEGEAPSYEKIAGTYTQQLPYISIVARSAPLYLTMGNHEGEYGYLLDGTADSLAALAARARTTYFPNPILDDFYSGNVAKDPILGHPQNYYAFTWGDALCISIDPYRYTTMEPYDNKDGWGWTLGKEQYDWFRKTLEESDAKYKFVFAHHAIGNMRGGAIIADLYEWGGYDRKGKYLFDEKRPGWGKPIQQIMKDTGVTVFFQGHDHLFAREDVDGVIYQTLPKPAEKIADRQSNEQSYPDCDLLLNSGFLNVTVGPENVQIDYYRNYFVSTEPQEGNTGLVYSYTVNPEHQVKVLKTASDDFSSFGSNEKTTKELKGDQKAAGASTTIWADLKQWICEKSGALISLITSSDVEDAATEKVYEAAETQTKAAPQEGAGGIILGCPADTSIEMKAVADSDCDIYFEYGPTGGSEPVDTEVKTYHEGEIVQLKLTGLSSDTGYSYRMLKRTSGDSAYTAAYSGTFHTQRVSGESFEFTVQADSHRDEKTDTRLYQITLDSIMQDHPDFHIDLGDTFMGEKLSGNKESTVQRYMEDRAFFARIGSSIPLFLVNGNHEGENGWNMKNGSNNIAVWASNARLDYFSNPSPDGFYSGSQPEQGNYYAFSWGDALFIMLDPFWFSENKARGDEDGWDYTLGKEQYNWLKATLEKSDSRHRFVFIHNLVGGYGKDARGGAEAARFFEWGGMNFDGTYGFDEMRPGWGKPIHQLLVENDVTAVFHGHDHFYARQELDGITYLLVPQPGHPGSDVKNAAEYSYEDGLFLPPAGYVRVSVSTYDVKVEYVKSSADVKQNGQIADSLVLN